MQMAEWHGGGGGGRDSFTRQAKLPSYGVFKSQHLTQRRAAKKTPNLSQAYLKATTSGSKLCGSLRGVSVLIL